jgi:hypothetical protein
MEGPVVCLDLDGVMNEFDGWRGADYFHPPRPGLTEFVRDLREAGYVIVIHTVRWAPHVWEWIRKHGLEPYISDVTNLKIPAHVYIDDRAVCFQGDFAETLERVKNFRAHWENTHKTGGN